MRSRAIPLAVLVATALSCAGEPNAERARLSAVASLAAGSAEGFARALEPRTFVFPDDHGAHEDFRTEWWYLTGNLAGPDGERYGYQLTLFRNALAPTMAPRESPWASRHAWLGHFALTDETRSSFLSAERWARGAVGLAGARTEPAVRVWVEDWEIAGQPDAGLEGATVRAAAAGASIELRLRPLKPIVLHGEEGLSRKGRGEGNASYYYSYTRIATHGTITRGASEVEVRGLSWMDREWSTSLLAPEQTGWDWFALQLEDGRDLMWFQLRDRAGGVDFASGTLVAADGSGRSLGMGTVEVTVRSRWTSPRTGSTYPAEWTLRVPDEALELSIRPLLADQELTTGFRYWEGAVTARGPAGEPLGRGYVELVGY